MIQKRNKRGSTTVFIILGLVFLMLAGLVMWRYTGHFTTNTQTETQGALSDYVTACIDQVFREGAQEILQTGGYRLKQFGNASYFTLDIDTTESDAVMLTDAGPPIAYWYAMTSDNTCTKCNVTTAKMPTEEKVNREIEQYVNEHLKTCTDGFGPFAQQGYEIEEGIPHAQVRMNAQDMLISVVYPITLTAGEKEIIVSEFARVVPWKIRNMIQTGQALVKLEKEKQFLEAHLLELITLYGGIEQQNLPPLTERTRESAPQVWSMRAVQEEMTTILAATVPLIHVKKAQTDPQTRASIENAMSSPDTFRISGLDSNFDVTFHYFNWPIYMDITPRQGDEIRPSTYRTTFPFGVFDPYYTATYEFYYDVSYPVVVEISDPNAAGTPHLFFALEGNIRDSIPLGNWHEGKGTIGLWTDESSTLDATGSVPISAECRALGSDGPYICSKTHRSYGSPQECTQACITYKEIELEEGIKGTFDCSEYQRTGTTLKLDVRDSKTKEKIAKPVVHYRCGSFGSCSIPARSENYRFPICYGGTMIVAHEGYLNKAVQLTSTYDATNAQKKLTVELDPLQNVGVSISIIDLDLAVKLALNNTILKSFGPELSYIELQNILKEADNLTVPPTHQLFDRVRAKNTAQDENQSSTQNEEEQGNLTELLELSITSSIDETVSIVRSLGDSEEITLTIELVEAYSGNTEQPLRQSLVFRNDFSLGAELRLVPGLYRVTSNYVEKEGTQIPAGCLQVCDNPCTLISGCCGYRNVPEEPINLTPLLVGGVQLDEATGLWNVTAEMLYDATAVHFTLTKIVEPTCVKTEGANIMGEVQEAAAFDAGGASGGAYIGTTILPGIGTAVGAAIGAIMGEIGKYFNRPTMYCNYGVVPYCLAPDTLRDLERMSSALRPALEPQFSNNKSSEENNQE